MNDLLMKLVLGKEVTEQEIFNELTEICERVHAGCDDDCPVYSLREKAGISDEALEDCECFKNGKLMAEFIRKNSQ